MADYWHRPCPVCGKDDGTLVFDNRLSPLQGIDLSYQVSQCDGCDFIFANRLAAPETYDIYYRTLSKYDVIPSAQAVPQVERYRAEAVVELCSPYFGHDASICDLGCGPGILLDAFRRRGWQRLTGIDPAPGAPAQALSLFGIDSVQCGMLADAHNVLPLHDVDLVCLTGVLEHLPRLREDMARLVAHLAPRTKLLVEVPALERFARQPFEPFGEFSLEHIQFFSAVTMARFLASLGYAPQAVSLLDLPKGYTDSLLGIFSRDPSHAVSLPAEPSDMAGYIARSESTLTDAVSRVSDCPAQQIVIYGAGAHTARLLPRLEQAGLRNKLIGVVDGNPNLQGKTIGPFTIQPPDVLSQFQDATILISSFRSQSAIASALAGKYQNPLLELY